MPIIGQVGRRRLRARLAMAFLYLFLCLGAVTTVTPFLLMAATGMTGTIDQNENRLWPTFLSDDAKLEERVLADKYAAFPAALDFAKAQSGGDPVEYKEYLEKLPPLAWTAAYRTGAGQVTSRLSLAYQEWLRKKFASVEDLNKAYLEENNTVQNCSPPTEMLERIGWKAPENAKWKDWLEFKKTLPAEFRIPVCERRVWVEFARSTARGKFEALPPEVRGTATKFEELSLVEGTELFQEYQRKFQASGITGTEVTPPGGNWPDLELDRMTIQADPGKVRQELASRNYRYVLDNILLNGRTMLNTAIFCGLAVLAQLLVNPLAAYALSRFPMPSTGRWLIYLLATMAFPAEVSMIPGFLLLKDLHLLDTVWALVLPSAASGYMIYLLKGFFDSLPAEVFESGQLDGASEFTLMRKLALPMARPVLGYLSLLAFMAAYGTFLHAFLVVQDRSKWTIMVFVYQLQTIAPKSTTMAALTLAAIPTLVVFLLCQRVIMRGIVLPGER